LQLYKIFVCIYVSFYYTLFKLIAKEQEKIRIQNQRDTEQQFRIDIVPFENVVHVLTVAIEFAGEPRYCALLPLQFLFYLFTYNHFDRHIPLEISQT
jgi:hypothetical protein